MRHSALRLASALLALLAASSCNDDTQPADDAGTVPTDADGDTGVPTRDAGDATRTDTYTFDTADGRSDRDVDATDTADAAAPDTDDAVDTAADADTGIEAVCGNGTVEPGEACDDGNTSDGDYCSSDCQTVTGRCGDGTLQSNESCDDGQITSNCDTYIDGGDGTCQPPGQCSSGYVWDGNKCVPEQKKDHVHISITNTCKLSVQPKDITIRNGRSVKLTYHNHSSSYSADVIYSGGGGGYYDLMPGSSWTSPIDWCTNKNRPYTVYIEILVHGFPLNDSTCPGHEFKIYCKK